MFHSSLVIVTSMWWKRTVFHPRRTKSFTTALHSSFERKLASKQRLPPTKRTGFWLFSKAMCPSFVTLAKPYLPAGASRAVTELKSRIDPGLMSFVYGKAHQSSFAASFIGGGGRSSATRPFAFLSESAKTPCTSNSTAAFAESFAPGNSTRSSKRSCLSLRASAITAFPDETESLSFFAPLLETTSMDPLSPTPIHSFS